MSKEPQNDPMLILAIVTFTVLAILCAASGALTASMNS